MVGRSLATLVPRLPSFLLIYIKHLIDSTQYAREVLASLISSSFLPSQLFHCSIRRVPLFFLPTLPRRLMKAWRETPLLMPEAEEGPTAPLLDQGSPEPTPRPRLPPPKFGELITVLSIDGGGIHGLITTVVLKCLEEKLQVSQQRLS